MYVLGNVLGLVNNALVCLVGSAQLFSPWDENSECHLSFEDFFPRQKVESVNSRSIAAPLSVQILRCLGAVLLRMVPAKLTGKTAEVRKRLDEEWKTLWCYYTPKRLKAPVINHGVSTHVRNK